MERMLIYGDEHDRVRMQCPLADGGHSRQRLSKANLDADRRLLAIPAARWLLHGGQLLFVRRRHVPGGSKRPRRHPFPYRSTPQAPQ